MPHASLPSVKEAHSGGRQETHAAASIELPAYHFVLTMFWCFTDYQMPHPQIFDPLAFNIGVAGASAPPAWGIYPGSFFG